MASARLTKTKLIQEIEDHMDTVAERMSREKSNAVVKRMSDMLTGMESLARVFGIRCDCFYTKWIKNPRTVCKCKPMTAEEKKYYRSGSHPLVTKIGRS